MSNDYRCVTEQEREQYNRVIAKEQTCVSEEDIRDMVGKWNTFELFQSGIKETPQESEEQTE